MRQSSAGEQVLKYWEACTRDICYAIRMDLPIVCTLTEAELRERRRSVLDSIRQSAIDITAIADGYSYRFTRTSEVLSQLSNLVDLERQCCQFLTFKIIVEAGSKAIALDVTGPPEAQSIIADYFGGVVLKAVIESVLTCPECMHAHAETMPTDQCVFFYECPNCRALLRPLPGDCCVFCSYGSVKCPLSKGPIRGASGAST